MMVVDVGLGEFVLAAKDVTLVGVGCIYFPAQAVVQSIGISVLPE